LPLHSPHGKDGQGFAFDTESPDKVHNPDELRRRGTLIGANRDQEGFEFKNLAAAAKQNRNKSFKQKPSMQLADISDPNKIEEDANESPFHDSHPSQADDQQSDEESQRFLK